MTGAEFETFGSPRAERSSKLRATRSSTTARSLHTHAAHAGRTMSLHVPSRVDTAVLRAPVPAGKLYVLHGNVDASFVPLAIRAS
jgi:hypothetical protein